MKKFKVGDIVTGTSGRYGVTNQNMTKGKVYRIRDFRGEQVIDIKILEHKNRSEVGKYYDDLYARHFELANDEVEVVRDFISDTSSPLESVDFEYDKKLKGTFVTINKKHIIFVDVHPEEIGVSFIGEKVDSVEVAKALALYRA